MAESEPLHEALQDGITVPVPRSLERDFADIFCVPEDGFVPVSEAVVVPDENADG